MFRVLTFEHVHRNAGWSGIRWGARIIPGMPEMYFLYCQDARRHRLLVQQQHLLGALVTAEAVATTTGLALRRVTVCGRKYFDDIVR